jgi:hypothetical protein
MDYGYTRECREEGKLWHESPALASTFCNARINRCENDRDEIVGHKSSRRDARTIQLVARGREATAMNTELPPELENPIRNSIVILLGNMGITLFRRNVGGFHIDDRFVRCAEPGQSDLYGTDWPHGASWARPWEIETKATGKRPTKEQLAWLKASTARGCVAFWCDNSRTAVNIATAILAGCRIVWLGDRDDFDLRTP